MFNGLFDDLLTSANFLLNSNRLLFDVVMVWGGMIAYIGWLEVARKGGIC
ncbi:hypothetical protein [Vibrio sinaloensis]|nr:hypothetical protein [Vibrio sinaloensis]MCZ4293601.1 hypothetical protein [Vibrio sinaloensis]